MHLIRWCDVRDVDLPYIESPFAARTKVEDLLSSGNLAWDLDRLGMEMDFSLLTDRERLHQRILDDVSRGELCLVIDSGLSGPFSPLAEWDGGQWRAKPTHVAWHSGPSLTAKVAQLNARAMTPADVRNARWPASAAPARTTPAPVERAPEPIVEPPLVVEPGFHIVRTSGTRDQIKQRLFPYGLTADIEAMFERLNPHLGGYVLPGDMVVLGDPQSRECREDEEFLMAEARAIHGALDPLEAAQRQSLMDHWQAYEDIALTEEAAAASALSNASTATGAISAAGSRALSETRQALETIDTLYRQAMDPASPMTREAFFTQRDQQFKRLSLVMNYWVNAPLRLARHPELKSRINVEARQQLHSVRAARSGGKFRISTLSEAITRATLVARLTSIGSYVGIGLDFLATQTTIEQACSEGRELECTKTQYVEYGGLAGRIFGAPVGAAAGIARTQPESRLCLAVSILPHGRVACSIIGAGAGAVTGEKLGGDAGSKLGAQLFTRIYGDNINGND